MRNKKPLEEKYGDIICRVESGDDISFVSSGSIGLNYIMGGGYPVGRITEIYGAESSGKTTLALTGVREFQKLNKPVVFIDMEHSLDLQYARKLGVSIDNASFLLLQPNYAEQAVDAMEDFIKTERFGLIVLDSVASLIPKAEMEGSMEDQQMGLQARLMSKMLRKITPIAKKNLVHCLLLNQTRTNLRIKFGNPEDTPGGKASKFYSTIRLRCSIKEKLFEMERGKKKFFGNRIHVKAVKNKVCIPYRECEFNIIFGRGIERRVETIELALNNDIIKRVERKDSVKGKSGYYFEDILLCRKRDNLKEYLMENKNLYLKIKKQLMSMEDMATIGEEKIQ